MYRTYGSWPDQRTDIASLWERVGFIRMKKQGVRHPDTLRAFRAAKDLRERA